MHTPALLETVAIFRIAGALPSGGVDPGSLLLSDFSTHHVTSTRELKCDLALA